MGSLISAVANWCGSLTGVFTILIIAIAASRMIMSGFRDKHGKESTFYKNARTFLTLFYVIFFINWIGAILGNMKDSAVQLGTNIASMPWAAFMALIIFYIVLLSSAWKHDRVYAVWIAMAVLICGVQLLTQDNSMEITGSTMMAGVVSFIISMFFSMVIPTAEEQIANNSPAPQTLNDTKTDTVSLEKNHKGLILTLIWIASLVAAYLAGEYSLIPKLVEFLQKHSPRKAERAKEQTEENVTNTSSPAIVEQ